MCTNAKRTLAEGPFRVPVRYHFRSCCSSRLSAEPVYGSFQVARRAGHIPLIGEWLALPLLREAGSKRPGDAIYDEILYPIANRLIMRCDAVLRLPGSSKGADEDVRLAHERGLPVWKTLTEVPGCADIANE